MFTFLPKSFLPKVYRKLTFVYDDDDNDDNAVTYTNIDNDDMYIGITLAPLCLSSLIIKHCCISPWMSIDMIDIY